MAEKGKTLNGEDHDYQRPSKITNKTTRDDELQVHPDYDFSE